MESCQFNSHGRNRCVRLTVNDEHCQIKTMRLQTIDCITAYVTVPNVHIATGSASASNKIILRTYFGGKYQVGKSRSYTCSCYIGRWMIIMISDKRFHHDLPKIVNGQSHHGGERHVCTVHQSPIRTSWETDIRHSQIHSHRMCRYPSFSSRCERKWI